MKKTIFALAVAALFGFSGALLTAAEDPSEATVLKLTGSVKVQLPGQSVATDLHVGDKVPQGATITTGLGSEVYLQPFVGTVSSIKENATVVVEKLTVTTQDGVVKKQNALLNLKGGNLVSNIDPSKRAINNYGVRTPKGVAAARGTSYSVSVSGGGFSIMASADSVTFTMPDGNTFRISQGMITITAPGQAPQPAGPLASVAVGNPAVTAMVQQAVTTFSAMVANNLGGLSAGDTAQLAAQVAGVASAALPSQASALTAQIVTAVTSPNSAASVAAAAAPAGGTTTQVADAISSITAAAATAAPQEAAAIASAAATAAPADAGAIVAAVTLAVPGSNDNGALTQSVATATGQTVEHVTQQTTQASAQATQAVQQTQEAVITVITPIDTSTVSPNH